MNTKNKPRIIVVTRASENGGYDDGGVGKYEICMNLEGEALLKAAPELLVALKDLVNAIYDHHLLDTKKRFTLCTAHAQATSAIHKAEGGK